ncbi:unnamed protein product [Prorocentrum cordatum]|uniref:Uncharacterized protein n=1 Tax=Prorocentrum cordatum TaxID=2364126 RepID=A0ABN9X908_9DINO|nr:unnamed protein product [Polarella glacialis]
MQAGPAQGWEEWVLEAEGPPAADGPYPQPAFVEDLARWIRDSVRVQAFGWIVATCGIFGPQGSWLTWGGLGGHALPWEAQRLAGWASASLLMLGWATGFLNFVMTSERRCMLYDPCGAWEPAVAKCLFLLPLSWHGLTRVVPK